MFHDSQNHLWEINRAELRKYRTTRIVTATVLVLLAAVLALVNAPPLTDCDSETPASLNKRWFRAIQTVAQPWRGPHHVYGVFSIPDQYRRHRLYTATLMIQGFAEEFPEISPESHIYSDPANPGQYIQHVYIPTRIAIWLLLTGRFGDLKMPCHWRLVIADRMRGE